MLLLAGAVGVEPTHNGFRDRRATITLSPNIYWHPHFGIEPRSGGLEPPVLPLHHRGILKRDFYFPFILLFFLI